jgi:LPXTG-motif cell wall-anchored protein
MRRMTRGGLVGAVAAIAVLGVLSVPVAAQDSVDGTPTDTTSETTAPTETTAAPETTAQPRTTEPDEPGSSLPDDTVPDDTAPEETVPQTTPPVTAPTENVPQPGPGQAPQAQPEPPAVVLPAGPVAAPQAAVRTDLPVTGPASAAVVGIGALALLAGGLVLRRSRRRADEVLVSHPL